MRETRQSEGMQLGIGLSTAQRERVRLAVGARIAARPEFELLVETIGDIVEEVYSEPTLRERPADVRAALAPVMAATGALLQQMRGAPWRRAKHMLDGLVYRQNGDRYNPEEVEHFYAQIERDLSMLHKALTSRLSRIEGSRRGRPPDLLHRHLIIRIAHAWHSILGERPGSSKGTPFVALCAALGFGDEEIVRGALSELC